MLALGSSLEMRLLLSAQRRISRFPLAGRGEYGDAEKRRGCEGREGRVIREGGENAKVGEEGLLGNGGALRASFQMAFRCSASCGLH